MRGTDASRYKEITDPEEIDLFWKAGLLHFRYVNDLNGLEREWPSLLPQHCPSYMQQKFGDYKFYVLTEED